MRNINIFLALGAGMMAAVVGACSSSSSPASGTPNDAGHDATGSGDDSSVDNSCSPPPLGSNLCTKGSSDTCCIDTSTGMGACGPASSCTSNIQVQCTTGADCATSTVCCAAVGGSAIAALEDGGINALGLDASAIAAIDAGVPTGLAALLAGINIKTSCETACAAGEVQTCQKDSDCQTGSKCVSLASLAGDAGIDAGAAGAGLGSFAGALGMQQACVSMTDSGVVPPVVDSGTPVSDAGDGGTKADSAP